MKRRRKSVASYFAAHRPTRKKAQLAAIKSALANVRPAPITLPKAPWEGRK